MAVTSSKYVALINETRVARQGDLAAVEKSILETEIAIKANETTIRTLDLKLDHTTRIFEAQRRDLATHQRDLADLNLIKIKLDEEMAHDERDTGDLLPFPDQTASKTANISKIYQKICDMQENMHARRSIQHASNSYLRAMKIYREGILSTIATLKSAFSPIYKVPRETWAIILSFRIKFDMERYLGEPGSISLCSTPVQLSHVCSVWRQVLHSEPNLWKYFVSGASSMLFAATVERWGHFKSFRPRELALITDIGPKPKSVTTLLPDYVVRAEMESCTHSIQIVCGDVDETLSAMSSVPFRGQSLLTLHLSNHVTEEFLNEMGALFPSFSTLTLISTQRLANMQPSLYGRREPNVEVLIMNLTDFEPFRVDFYCDEAQVKELHVQHNGNRLLQGYSRMSYSQLRILGITPPETNWFNSHKLPSLYRLILYGPKLRAVDAPSLIDLSGHADFHRVRELELEKWPTYEPENTPSWSIMALILKIADKLRLVETIRCTDSFIEGETFVTLVKSLKSGNSTSTASMLKTVIIDCCTGITRHDCEVIAGSVEKLVVYV